MDESLTLLLHNSQEFIAVSRLGMVQTKLLHITSSDPGTSWNQSQDPAIASSVLFHMSQLAHLSRGQEINPITLELRPQACWCRVRGCKVAFFSSHNCNQTEIPIWEPIQHFEKEAAPPRLKSETVSHGGALSS